MRDNSNITKKFGYNASRDIMMMIILFAFMFLGWHLLKGELVSIDAQDFIEHTDIYKWLWFGSLTFLIIFQLLEIANRSCSCLIIAQNEVIYKYGWIQKTTTSIPVNKIRVCTKKSGILQRIYNTMNVSITVSGDLTEITFHNIDHGDEAYELISQIARENCKK